MKISRIYSGQSGFCDVYQDDQGRVYLVALCAGIAWTQVGIVMTDDEVREFTKHAAFADALALKLCKDFEPYKGRAIPADVRDTILGIGTQST